MNNEFNLADAVIARLGRQVGELVVQLAIKDSEIEQLNARLRVQESTKDYA